MHSVIRRGGGPGGREQQPAGARARAGGARPPRTPRTPRTLAARGAAAAARPQRAAVLAPLPRRPVPADAAATFTRQVTILFGYIPPCFNTFVTFAAWVVFFSHEWIY